VQSPEDLQDKTVLFGVTGGIAAYKAVEVVSALRRRGAEVMVVMTDAASELVSPLTFQTISANPVYTDMFAEPKQWNVEHIELAQRADLFAVVPATANIIAKIACGIADDFLSTTWLAFTGPRIIAPAMNANMWDNPVTQRNLRCLTGLGCEVIEPDRGRLASGAEGRGRLPEPGVITEEISSALHGDCSLSGYRILVTAGPTREYFDPVRYLSNPSSGKMGYALARAARERGAGVHLVSGPTDLSAPRGVQLHRVTSAEEMLERCRRLWPQTDALFMCAAVCDYRPARHSEQKIKKDEGQLGEMVRTPDIVTTLSEESGKRFILGFAAETDEVAGTERAVDKMRRKGMDMIALNPVGEARGFGMDANRVVLIDDEGSESLPEMHKLPLARGIVDRVVRVLSV